MSKITIGDTVQIVNLNFVKNEIPEIIFVERYLIAYGFTMKGVVTRIECNGDIPEHYEVDCSKFIKAHLYHLRQDILRNLNSIYWPASCVISSNSCNSETITSSTTSKTFKFKTEGSTIPDKKNNKKIPMMTTTVTMTYEGKTVSSSTSCKLNTFHEHTGVLVATAKLASTLNEQNKMLYNIAIRLWNEPAISGPILYELANLITDNKFEQLYEKYCKEKGTSTKYKCPKCGKVYYVEDALNQHIEWHKERRKIRHERQFRNWKARKQAKEIVNSSLINYQTNDLVVEYLKEEIDKLPDIPEGTDPITVPLKDLTHALRCNKFAEELTTQGKTLPPYFINKLNQYLK